MAWKELTAEYSTYLSVRAALVKDASKLNATGDDATIAAANGEIAAADRFMLNRLLLDVASSLDSLAFSYRKIYEMSEAREKRATGRS